MPARSRISDAIPSHAAPRVHRATAEPSPGPARWAGERKAKKSMTCCEQPRARLHGSGGPGVPVALDFECAVSRRPSAAPNRHVDDEDGWRWRQEDGEDAERTCDEEVEEGEQEEVADVEHCARDRVEGEAHRPVDDPVREQPERAPAADEERTPVPPVCGVSTERAGRLRSGSTGGIGGGRRTCSLRRRG